MCAVLPSWRDFEGGWMHAHAPTQVCPIRLREEEEQLFFLLTRENRGNGISLQMNDLSLLWREASLYKGY